MIRRSIIPFLFLLLIAPALVYSGGTRETNGAGPGIQLITAEQLESIMASEVLTILDIRDTASYAQGHIPGAVLLLLEDVPERGRDYIVRGRRIVTYCSCPSEESSMNAALQLREFGAQSVLVLKGGYRGWVGAGNQVVTGSRP